MWTSVTTDHATVLRRWNGRWDVEVVGLSLDVLTVRVGRPPATVEDALALAAEVYLYCADAVDQGLGTLDALAGTISLPAWRLWWD